MLEFATDLTLIFLSSMVFTCYDTNIFWKQVFPVLLMINFNCRMPIIDKFKDMGTVVMGKVESGCIRDGDSLIVMPNKV